jgi:hypothetical protein
LTPHSPAARFGYGGSRRLEAAGRAYTKETAMLASVCGLIADGLLPPTPAYVDSFGPFYLELGPTTSARNHRPNAVRRARDILETMAGLSPATGGITNGRASITLASSSKLKAPTGLSVSDTGRGFSSALRGKIV